MDKALPDALVTGYEHIIESIELPDRDDQHVLAAAIHCRASVIVTLNLGDFPGRALADFSIEAQHPDDFVLELLENSPNLVADTARSHRMSLKHPAKTRDEYLAELEVQGLEQTVITVRKPIANHSFDI